MGKIKWTHRGLPQSQCSTTAASIFNVHQLSGSWGWPSLSRGLLGGHSFLCRKYPPKFPGIRAGTGHYFFKKQKMFQAHWQDSRSFLPGRMKKKSNMVFWCSQNDFQAGSGVCTQRGTPALGDEERVIPSKGWLSPDTHHLGILTKLWPQRQSQGRWGGLGCFGSSSCPIH